MRICLQLNLRVCNRHIDEYLSIAWYEVFSSPVTELGYMLVEVC